MNVNLADEPLDVFIPIAPKDLFRIKLVISHLMKNVSNIQTIHLCTPSPIDKLPSFNNVVYWTDRQILPYVDPKMWKFRPNWIYQQFLKLFQNVTETKYYLTVDADVVIANTLKFFRGSQPVWYYGADQDEIQYKTFNKVMFNLEQHAKHTYIGDIGMFSKQIIRELVSSTQLTEEEIIYKSYAVVDVGCHLSEFELYGNFIEKHYPGLYITERLKSIHCGKLQTDPYMTNWTHDEVIELIKRGESGGYDVVNMHSWCIPNHEWDESRVSFA